MASYTSRSSVVLGVIAVVLVAIVAMVLTVLALGHVRAETPGAVAPAPPIVQQTGAATPTPPRTTTAAPDPAYDRTGELFLTVGEEALWRAWAGGCGTEPLLERSVDGGGTWADVTPRYLGIAQIMSVTPLQSTEADIVATAGAACETRALRTYTQGEFWDTSADALASSRWIDSADRALVHLSGSAVSAPCADARGLRAADAVIALVCDGLAWEWGGSAWEAVPVDGVAAVAVDEGSLLLARAQDGCPGVAVLRIAGDSPEQIGCAPDVDPAGALAMAVDDADVLLWAGDDVIRLPLSGS